MLIDRSHRPWFVGTAAAAVISTGVYWWYSESALQPLTGGTTVGLWYGIAGVLLMIFAGLLSAHRRLARWPLLPRRSWLLKGHIWLGLLSFLFILLHSGFRWGGSLTTWLWLVFGAVVVSGVAGLVLQNMLPRLLAERIAEETPYEQMPHVCRQISRRALQLAEALALTVSESNSQMRAAASNDLRDYYNSDISPFLAGTACSTSALHDASRTKERFVQFSAMTEFIDDKDKQRNLKELEDLCDQRRQINTQERIHEWLHGWLLIHIPLSLALLVLALAHIVMTTFYY